MSFSWTFPHGLLLLMSHNCDEGVNVADVMLTLKFFFLIFRNTVEMQIKQDLAQQGTRGVRKFVGPVTVAVQVKS